MAKQETVFRVYDERGNVTETHKHAGQFRLAIPTFNKVTDELAEAGTRGTLVAQFPLWTAATSRPISMQ